MASDDKEDGMAGGVGKDNGMIMEARRNSSCHGRSCRGYGSRKKMAINGDEQQWLIGSGATMMSWASEAMEPSRGLDKSGKMLVHGIESMD